MSVITIIAHVNAAYASPIAHNNEENLNIRMLMSTFDFPCRLWGQESWNVKI